MDPLRLVVLVPPLENLPDSPKDMGANWSASEDHLAAALDEHDGGGGFAADEILIEDFGVYAEMPEEIAAAPHCGKPFAGGALTFAFGAATTSSHARRLIEVIMTTTSKPSFHSSLNPNIFNYIIFFFFLLQGLKAVAKRAGGPFASTPSVPIQSGALGGPSFEALIDRKVSDAALPASSAAMTPRDAFFSQSDTVEFGPSAVRPLLLFLSLQYHADHCSA